MTFNQFCRCSPRAQLLCVMTEGTYLVQRWENKNSVKLYHLSDGRRGFFAEVGIDEVRECYVVLSSFSSSVPLEQYAGSVRLPG